MPGPPDPVDDDLLLNALLAQLPPDELDRLRPLVQVVDAEVGDEVYRRRDPITEVHFPLTAVYSLVAVVDDRIQVEVGTVGYEGMVGLPLFLGATTSPNATFCQVPGRAARMSAGDFGSYLALDGDLHGRLHRYTQSTMVQMAQNVVCNAGHGTARRAARWLLTTADRTRSATFPLTQEFLAQMLGVRRPTVSETAGQLQAAGLIRYTRGVITITDRDALHRAACECYDIVREEFDTVTP